MFGQNGSAPATSTAWWPSEGLSSVQSWDALIARLAKTSDPEAREKVLEWIGRSDIPGSPAERYKVVVDDLNRNFMPSTPEQIASLRNRVDQLEANTSQLEAKVKNAEKTFGVYVASTAEAPSMPDADMMMECVTGSIALLGLVIMPLLLD